MSDSQIDLQDFRQPVVTSLGVILGFLLGFLGQWVTEEEFNLTTMSDMMAFSGTIIGSTLLLYALFRMLLPEVKAKVSLSFYRATIRIYMAGIVIPLISIVAAAFV